MGVGSQGALALNFSRVCACVCARVSFHAPGLTLRVWRVVTMVHLTNSGPGAGPSRTCSHPALCRPPSPTASLALRASLCSGMCALALPACLPPYLSVQVSGSAVSAHAPPSTLASRLSSLALCLPVCLWSVLSVSLTLPSGLSWVSTWSQLHSPHMGFQLSPLLTPLWGAPSFLTHTLPFLLGLLSRAHLIQVHGLHWVIQLLPSFCFPVVLHSAPSAAWRPAPTQPGCPSHSLHLFLQTFSL